MKILLSFVITLSALSSVFAQTQAGRETGFEFYERGEYRKAIEVFRAAVETDKKDRRSWLFLAMALAKTGDAKEAFKAVRKGASVSDKKQADAFYDKELRIVSKPRPRYTEAARRSMTTGRVRLAVEFGADGLVKFILPVEGLPDGLTENCIEVARQIKFEPAVKGGKAVTVIKTVDYSFDIY